MIATYHLHGNRITKLMLLIDYCRRALMSLCHACKRKHGPTKVMTSCCRWGAISCTKTPTAGTALPRHSILLQCLASRHSLVIGCNRYRNLDRLIAAVNADGRVHARYSTPDEYAATKHASNLTWPIKYDDFFPYSSNAHEVWR